MCGIAGWVLNQQPSVGFVLSLAFHMQDRGPQSYGYFDGETRKVYRDTGSITRELNARRLQFKRGFFHTRFATTGKVTKENTHPFMIGKPSGGATLIGAHNGMIDNHAELNKKYSRKCSVDSQHIFFHIADGLPLSELQGYGAVEYFDGHAYRIGVSNNGELSAALLNCGVVWASTRRAIDTAIAQSRRLKLVHYYDIKQNQRYIVLTSGLRCPMLYEDGEFKLGERQRQNTWQSCTYGGYNTANTNWKQYSVPNDRYSQQTRDYSDYDTCDWCNEFARLTTTDDDQWDLCYECLDAGGYLETGNQALTSGTANGQFD